MPKDFPYTLSIHARKMIQERHIPLEWIAQTMEQPERILPDKEDPSLCHVLKRISEHGDRVLRVVYNERKHPWHIVTVYFDRNQRKKL